MSGATPQLVVVLLALLVLIPAGARAQDLTPVSLPDDAVTEAPLYEDEKGRRYSTLVVVKFNDLVFDLPRGQKSASLADVEPAHAAVATALQQVATSHGTFSIEKMAPNAVWGDTLRTNKRTGATVAISDYSQLFELWFKNPVPLDEVVADLERLPEVAYVERPQVYHLLDVPNDLLDVPNDPEYVNQWELQRIDAPRAWDITQGVGPLQPVGIAFTDLFPCELAGVNMHPDLINKLTVVECTNTADQHGYIVAGMAGAETDNGQYVASLGWDVNLYGYGILRAGVVSLLTDLGDPSSLVYGRVDVLQNSWRVPNPDHAPTNEPTLREAVRDLLNMGIVVVGSAGNGHGCVPNGTGTCYQQQYPAALYYDDLDAGDGTTYEARVIGVSATNPLDEFVDTYTWSPGTNPLMDPERAFIDVAAPGKDVTILLTDGLGGGPYNHRTYPWGSGTSFAGPMVAAQVALILAINPNLRVDEVYEIVTRSAEKVDQSEHPDTFFYTDPQTGEQLSWNQYTGYGRINAYKALKYTIERFGATIPEGQTARLSDDTFRMWTGSTLVANGSLQVQDVTFVPRPTFSPFPTIWGGIVLNGDGSTFEGVTVSGASTGIAVRARNTGLIDTRLVGNEKAGLTTDYVACIGICRLQRSEVYLDHVLVEDNAAYGLYLRNTEFAISESTVRDNGDYGVYISNATATVFDRNVIEDNGSDGLRVAANGQVDFSRRGDIVGIDGLNRIAGNAGYQVAYLNGGYLFMGSYILGGGLNAITGTGSGCRIYNTSGSILEAENNYWGTTSAPPASYFCGTHSVDASPYLTSDPTGGSGGGYRLAPETAELLAFAGDGGPDAHQRGGDQDATARLREQILLTRGQLVSNPEAADAPLLVRLLAGLHRRDPGDETGEWAATEDVFRQFGEHLRQGSPDHLPPRLRRVAEGAVIVLTEAALAAGDFEKAGQILANYEPVVAGEEEVLTLSLDAIAVDEALGRYDAALARIEALIQRVGDGHGGLAEDLALLAEVIAAKAEGGSAGRGTGPGHLAEASAVGAASKHGDGAGFPAEYALLVPYPNPTMSTTAVPLELVEAAEVRVAIYDVLGREVAVLADGLLESGRHALRFDGSHLAGGTYLVVASVKTGGREVSRVLRQKVTVLR